MNIHITHDDKFIDGFIGRVKELGELHNNKFYIYPYTDNLRFVKSEEVVVSDINSKEIVDELLEAERVYIHYFDDSLIDFIKNINTTVIWVFWGADAFDLPNLKSLYSPNPSTEGYNLYRLFKERYNAKKSENRKKNAMRNIAYFAHYIEEDFQLIKKTYKLDKLEYIDFTYGTLEQFTSNIVPSKINNILIGNSAHIANNHINAIKKIKEIVDTTVYVPLSYSGTEDYKDEVIQLGTKYFGEKFKPLTKFLSFNEYNEVLKTISIAIMPHTRSQAFGNIIALLYSGVKVYMSNDSSLYKLLKQLGVELYSIENIFDKKSLYMPLTNKQIKKNIEVLNKYLGKIMSVNRMKQILFIND